jgi:hypothetical protein
MALGVVQHRSIQAAGVSSLSLAFLSPTTLGNLLIYAIQASGALPALSTDNAGNTVENIIAAGLRRLDYVRACKGGACTVTANGSGSEKIHLHIWEISGADMNPLDQSNTKTQSSSNSPSISTASPTIAASELVFGQFQDFPNDDALTAGAGSLASEFTDGQAGNESMLTEVYIVSVVGVQTAGITLGPAQTITMAIATFMAVQDSFTESLAFESQG